MADLLAFLAWLSANKWYAIVIVGMGAAAWWLLRAYTGGIAKAFKKVGEEDGERIFKYLDLNDSTRAYVGQARKAYSHFKFRGLPKVRAKGIEPPQLDQAFVSVLVMPETRGDDTREIKHDGAGAMDLAGPQRQAEPLPLSQVAKDSKRLAIIGVAGSGKSTLLQWAGLAFARALLKEPLSEEQKEFVDALGGKPLVPFLLPLRDYSSYCRKNNCRRSSKTLLSFMGEYFSDHHASLELNDDFFKSHLNKGCLLMLDGLDEVDPDDRQGVCAAVEELLVEFDNPNLRCFISSRYSAVQVADQMRDFRTCEVRRLSPAQRDDLIKMWYKAVLADNPREAGRKAEDLCSRIEDSDQRVKDLATTPLMVTIFAMVHYSRDELPKQRAKLYEDAVEVLLTEITYKGEEGKELQHWGGVDWEVRRDRIARIAFELRERDRVWLLENDLVNLIWKRFGNDEAEARRASAHFLRDVAERGGLLESEDEKYGFFTHATFQEYLAGRYLAEEYPTDDLPAFLRVHVPNDLWDEPLRLAVGYLAIKGEEKANRFVMQIADSGMTEATVSRALYVAGLALSDIPADRRLPDSVNYLVPRMMQLLEADPPRASVRARFNLGLALGSLGDPRLHSQEPVCVRVPAGIFRLGTGDADKSAVEEQAEKEFSDERPSHDVYISEFFIGKYPVTNFEFATFWDAKGYENQVYWSREGWSWRTGKWEPNLSAYEDNSFRKVIEDWLARRPVELRDKPFYWDDPRWNGSNLPVVGVSWFEAEAYCNWLSHATGRPYRLPTEAEWEKAARGEENFVWNWGNAWNGELCNNADSKTVDRLGRTSPVGMYPAGASGYGVLDLLGNVWEWCSDWYLDDIYGLRAGGDVRNPQGPDTGTLRVVRGGSWYNDRNLVRCASRGRLSPDLFDDSFGFRVVLSPEQST